MLLTPFIFLDQQRQIPSFTQDVIPYLHNNNSQYTNPLPFETEPHSIQTIPILRKHAGSYLFYIRYKTIDITPSQTPFQVVFITSQK